LQYYYHHKRFQHHHRRRHRQSLSSTSRFSLTIFLPFATSSRKTKNAGMIVMQRMYQNERRKLPLLLAIMDMTNGPTQELPLSVNSKKLKNSLSRCGGINSQNNVREKD